MTTSSVGVGSPAHQFMQQLQTKLIASDQVVSAKAAQDIVGSLEGLTAAQRRLGTAEMITSALAPHWRATMAPVVTLAMLEVRYPGIGVAQLDKTMAGAVARLIDNCWREGRTPSFDSGNHRGRIEGVRADLVDGAARSYSFGYDLRAGKRLELQPKRDSDAPGPTLRGDGDINNIVARARHKDARVSLTPSSDGDGLRLKMSVHRNFENRARLQERDGAWALQPVDGFDRPEGEAYALGDVDLYTLELLRERLAPMVAKGATGDGAMTALQARDEAAVATRASAASLLEQVDDAVVAKNAALDAEVQRIGAALRGELRGPHVGWVRSDMVKMIVEMLDGQDSALAPAATGCPAP